MIIETSQSLTPPERADMGYNLAQKLDQAAFYIHPTLKQDLTGFWNARGEFISSAFVEDFTTGGVVVINRGKSFLHPEVWEFLQEAVTTGQLVDARGQSHTMSDQFVLVV